MLESADPDNLAKVQERRARLVTAEVRLQKLNVALATIGVAEKSRQLQLIRSAFAFVEKIGDGDPIPGMKKILGTINNELVSLRDGIRTGEAKGADLFLTTGVEAVKQVKAKIAKTDVLIAQLQAGSDSHMDQNEKLINENRGHMDKLPNLSGSDKEFAIARMPVAFTFQNKQGHSSVGYVSPEALDLVGFKVQNVAGYTIIHNQVVIGINAKAIQMPVFDDEGKLALDEGGRPITEVMKIKEVKTTFKGGKPTKKAVRRPKTLKDVADKVIELLNQKSPGANYELVSDKPQGAKGAGWFWVMPAKDIKRLAKAMPGNHVGIAKWGFAS